MLLSASLFHYTVDIYKSLEVGWLSSATFQFLFKVGKAAKLNLPS